MRNRTAFSVDLARKKVKKAAFLRVVLWPSWGVVRPQVTRGTRGTRGTRFPTCIELQKKHYPFSKNLIFQCDSINNVLFQDQVMWKHASHVSHVSQSPPYAPHVVGARSPVTYRVGPDFCAPKPSRVRRSRKPFALTVLPIPLSCAHD